MAGTGIALTEHMPVAVRSAGTTGRWIVQLIEADVQGSSGFYPAAVLQRDGAKAFPQGLQMFYDHPTRAEEHSRPERSVRDLAGVLLENAYYENGPNGHGLFAKAQLFGEFRERADEWQQTVGLSIRASGTAVVDPETKRTIITEITSATSLDVVTRAGAGGRLVSMTENARPAEQPPAPLFAELKESDKRGMNTLFDAVSQLSAQVTELQAKLAESQTTADPVTPVEEPKAEGLSLGQIVEKLDASELSPNSRQRVATAYEAGKDLDQLIADEKSLVEEIKESLKTVPGAVGNLRESGSGATDYTMLLRQELDGIGYTRKAN